MKFSAKKINLILFLFLGVLTLTMTSCAEQEGCTDPAAENYDPDADIDNGSCVYARDKFIGTYAVTDDCSILGSFTYTMTITEGTAGISSILLENLSDSNQKIRAVVTGDNVTFNDAQGGITFDGTGNINGNTLTINYSATALGFTNNCSATCIKQ